MDQKTSLKPIDVFRNQAQSAIEKFRFALPRHITAEKFISVLNTAVTSNPDLLTMSRQSLFISATKCANDGLLPDGREAVLLPFKGVVTYIPMVYGLIQKAYRSGEVASIRAHLVCANDHFKLQYGDDEYLEHTPNLEDRGEPKFAYAIAKLKSGEILREVLNQADIAKIRNMSRAKSGPWFEWQDQMWEKSAIRRLAKRLPTSVSVQTQGDDEENYNPPQELSAPAAEDAPKRRGRPPRATHQIEHSSVEESGSANGGQTAETEEMAAGAHGGNGQQGTASASEATAPANTQETHDPETGEVKETKKASSAPMTALEYEESRMGMIFEAKDPAGLDAFWKNEAEKKLRNRLNVTPEARDKMFAAVQERIRELQIRSYGESEAP